MSNKQLRQAVRIFHSIIAVILGTLVYGPWGDGSLLELSVQVVFFPALGLSGLILWQQARITQFFRRRTQR